MKVEAFYNDNVFEEGSLVCTKDEPNAVYLVTVPAEGYGKDSDGTFWAIDLTGMRCSGGNYRKSLFQPFRGVIKIEV